MIASLLPTRLSTPCPSLRERRGVVVRGARLLTAALCGLICAGCSLGPTTPPTGTVKIPVKTTPGKGLSPITNQTLTTWLQKAFAKKPALSNAPTTPVAGAPAIYIDTSALAHRHPAWRLAERLEHALTAAPASPGHGGPPPQMPAAPAGPGGSLPSAAVGRQRLPSETLIVQGGGSAQRDVQTAATERFLTASAERNEQLARDAERWARQFLEDEVEVARRKAVTEIDPKQLPESVQLQLENLTLELLPRIKRTEAEKLAARAKIDAIERSWQLELRAQERAQVARVEHALNDVPREVRQKGEERIQRLLTRIKTERAGSHETVRAEQAALLDKDFARGSLDLSLKLPPATVLAPGRNVFTSSPRPQKISETLAPILPSQGARMHTNLTVAAAGARADLIRDLRAEATREANGWAQLAALHLGGRLAKGPGIPDRTADALRLVAPLEPGRKMVR